MNSLDKYFELFNNNPELFHNSSYLKIILDRNELEKYEKENNCQLGVIYESEYNVFVKDLVIDSLNNIFVYERLIKPQHGVVIITMYKDKYVFLKQYRHALRDFQLSFPRGFKIPSISSQENAIKELKEETGAIIDTIKYIGTFIPDSGLSENSVDVYIAHIKSFELFDGYEGISEIVLLTKEELSHLIENHLFNDGMSLSALAMYKSKSM